MFFYRALKPAFYLAVAAATTVLPVVSVRAFHVGVVVFQEKWQLLALALGVPVMITVHGLVLARLLQQALVHSPVVSKALMGLQVRFAPVFVAGYGLSALVFLLVLEQHPLAAVSRDVGLARSAVQYVIDRGGAPPVQNDLRKWTRTVGEATTNRYALWDLARSTPDPAWLALFWQVHGTHAFDAETVRFVQANRLLRYREKMELEDHISQALYVGEPTAWEWGRRLEELKKAEKAKLRNQPGMDR